MLSKTTVIQTLLDAQAQLKNSLYMDEEDRKKQIIDTEAMIVRQIEVLRGPAPECYGEDDCGTLILSMCPWRMTCGS